MDTTIIVAIIALVATIIASLVAALAGVSVPFISHWLKQREIAKKKPPRTTYIPPAGGQNPFFTGREEILEEIKTKLHSVGRVVLTGIPGVGKTQTAAEYAYRESDRRVLWVNADSRDSLTSGFAALAQKLKLDEKDAPELDVVVRAVRARLESEESGTWLLVLDNADDLALAQEFMPAGKHGHILLTARPKETGPIPGIEIEHMEPDEGALFLLRRAKIPTEDGKLDAYSAGHQERAKAISEELGGLPLALDQAGAYIEEKRQTLEEYQRLYRREGKQFRARRGDLAGPNHPESVTTTYSMAFGAASAENREAADLLRLCAFLAPADIPEELFTEAAGEAVEQREEGRFKTWRNRLLRKPPCYSPHTLAASFEDAVGTARRFALLRHSRDDKTISVHRLVQAVIKDDLRPEDQRVWSERMIRKLNHALPWPEYPNWPQCEPLLPHAMAARQAIEDQRLESRVAANLLLKTANYLYQRAQYEQAEPLYERALAITERALGPDHPDTAQSLNNLAALYGSQGHYEQAEPLYQRALAISEKALGPDHPSTATSLNNLAALYRSQGRYEEAEPLYQRALAISEKALGPDHPSTATSLNNLAELYRSQGRYEEAEPLLQRALGIREKALGPDHPSTATSLNNLAALYDSQGRYDEAEPLYQRALGIREKALGPDHPSTASSLNNLAELYRSQGRYDEAEPLYQRALGIREKALGPDHPDTAGSLNNLAALYDSQGRYDEAEPLYQRALGILEKALGPDHPDTASSLNNLAEFYRSQGRYDEAEPLYQRALGIREKALGPDHPDTAGSLNNLAALYDSQGQYEQAEPLYQRALAILEKALPGHPNVATCLENYAGLLGRMGREEQAAEMRERAKAIRVQREARGASQG